MDKKLLPYLVFAEKPRLLKLFMYLKPEPLEYFGILRYVDGAPEARDYVLGTLSGLYKDVRFRRNKKTGEIALWGDGKLLKIWPKTNF